MGRGSPKGEVSLARVTNSAIHFRPAWRLTVAGRLLLVQTVGHAPGALLTRVL